MQFCSKLSNLQYTFSKSLYSILFSKKSTILIKKKFRLRFFLKLLNIITGRATEVCCTHQRIINQHVQLFKSTNEFLLFWFILPKVSFSLFNFEKKIFFGIYTTVIQTKVEAQLSHKLDLKLIYVNTLVVYSVYLH